VAEDQPVDDLPAVPLQHLALAVRVGGRLVDEQRHAAGVRRPLDVVGELGEVRGGDLGQGQPDHAGAPEPQRPGADVGLEAELLDGLLHPLPGLRAHVHVAADHVGHRSRGHAGEDRDVPHAGRHDRRLRPERGC